MVSQFDELITLLGVGILLAGISAVLTFFGIFLENIPKPPPPNVSLYFGDDLKYLGVTAESDDNAGVVEAQVMSEEDIFTIIFTFGTPKCKIPRSVVISPGTGPESKDLGKAPILFIRDITDKGFLVTGKCQGQSEGIQIIFTYFVAEGNTLDSRGLPSVE
jgi:hypothetical protein